MYPGEVAGMMLIDAGRLDPWRFINGKLVQFNTTATGKPVPAVVLPQPTVANAITSPCIKNTYVPI
jgi:hypothetical protein